MARLLYSFLLRYLVCATHLRPAYHVYRWTIQICIEKIKKKFIFVRLAVAAVCKSKVISLVANIHASARAMCVEYNGCVLVAF
jgi:hypothetical protein